MGITLTECWYWQVQLRPPHARVRMQGLARSKQAAARRIKRAARLAGARTEDRVVSQTASWARLQLTIRGRDVERWLEWLSGQPPLPSERSEAP